MMAMKKWYWAFFKKSECFTQSKGWLLCLKDKINENENRDVVYFGQVI